MRIHKCWCIKFYNIGPRIEQKHVFVMIFVKALNLVFEQWQLIKYYQVSVSSVKLGSYLTSNIKHLISKITHVHV